jgi:hypothetical protein
LTLQYASTFTQAKLRDDKLRSASLYRQSDVSRGPRAFVKYTAVNIRVLIVAFKSVRKVFIQSIDFVTRENTLFALHVGGSVGFYKRADRM